MHWILWYSVEEVISFFFSWCWWRCEVALTPLTYWCMTFFGWVGFWRINSTSIRTPRRNLTASNSQSRERERERRSWSGSARNLEFKNRSRGAYLPSFIPSFSQISPKFYKIWDEINWKISCTWAWSIYGKLIHENFMSTSSVLANLENSSKAEELGQNFHWFWCMIRTALEKSSK